LAADDQIFHQMPSSRPDSEVELDVLVRAEHLRVTFKNAPIVVLANLSAGVTLTAGLWSVVPQDRLLVWLVVLALFQGARWVGTRGLPRKPPEIAAVRQQEILLLAVTALSGLLWGSAAILFYVPHEPAASLFLALILVAMAAASTALLSFHRFAYPAFLAPVIIPLGVQLAAEDGMPQLAIALVIPVYFSLLFILSRQIYRFTHEAIRTALVRERHALVDHLTAIPNRRAFEEFLAREWSRGMRTKRPLTLIVADIDDFKAYNDGYGHAVGDAILRAVAGLFRLAARRGTDLAARLGGDEFVLLAPETDRLGASIIERNIERARELLAQNTYKAWAFPTLSFGLCTVIPSEAGSAFALFEEADAALYEAKAARRNRAAECSVK
jgi:diguanylate cyclase (GGDEF)-like protein